MYHFYKYKGKTHVNDLHLWPHIERSAHWIALVVVVQLCVFHSNKYFVVGTSSVNQKVSSSNLFHSEVCIYLNFPPRLQMFMGEAISISVLDDTSVGAAGGGNFLVCVCTFLYKQVTYFLEA